MPREYSDSGAQMPNDDYVIPDDDYILEIKKVKEGSSKAGDYQVTCDLEVVEGEFKGFEVRYHRVTFIPGDKNPKAAGMSLHFLKTIGQPYQGKFKIEPSKWVGRRFQAYLEEKEYQGFKSMQVKWVAPLEEAQPEPEDERVPF